jgi:hypothetical protein
MHIKTIIMRQHDFQIIATANGMSCVGQQSQVPQSIVKAANVLATLQAVV